jgi:hypothetical protein
MSPAKDEYRAVGKQVLLNGSHYADAKDELAAQSIAYALNSVYLARVGVPCEVCKQIGTHAPACNGRTADADAR